MRLCVIDRQGDSPGQFSIFGGDSMVYFEKKTHINACLTLDDYRDGAVCICRPNSVRFLLVGFVKERSQQNAQDELLVEILMLLFT
jgi:hypothetical protein